tara:strand:- start:55 stop:864 length:810 start_codon:yes stop_codon:yes gene_type:complete
MKKYILLFIFLFVVSCTNETSNDIGQVLTRDGVIYSEKTNKPINGILEYSSKSGAHYETSYKNGIKNGVHKIYDEDMRLIKRENYQDGTLHGLYESFDPNGQVIFSGNYQNGKEIGIWRFFDNTGKLLATGNSLWDARDNHSENRKKMRIEERKKSDIPSELFICNGTEIIELTEPYFPSTQSFNEVVNLIIDYKNKKITFGDLAGDISKITDDYISMDYSINYSFIFYRKNKTVVYSLNDMDDYHEIVPGLGSYVVKYQYLYECEKSE